MRVALSKVLIYFEENKLLPKLWAKRMGIWKNGFWTGGTMDCWKNLTRWSVGMMEKWKSRFGRKSCPSGDSLLLTLRNWMVGRLE
jgi:hypothetical protein